MNPTTEDSGFLYKLGICTPKLIFLLISTEFISCVLNPLESRVRRNGFRFLCLPAKEDITITWVILKMYFIRLLPFP